MPTPRTLVAFHAHPDDESLLTGGVLARSAAEGHRVVLVVATDGGLGLAKDGDRLAARRAVELKRAGEILGIHRIVSLGYADSGYDAPPDPPPGSFCTIAVDEVARRLADILVEENADLLTVYDAMGGYGHRDHVHVRATGLAAAALAHTPRVLAATVEREALLRAVGLLSRLGVRPGGMTTDRLLTAFTPAAEITHAIDVRPWVRRKRAALRAHASQSAGGADLRTVRLLAHLPRPIASIVLGREWFTEIGAEPPVHRAVDVFVSPESGTVTR